jgi:hypothetical protein
VACSAFRASRRRRTFGQPRNSFCVCSFVYSSHAGISFLRIVTGLLLLLALFAFCGWLYFSRQRATGLPAGLLLYERCRPPTPPAAACFTPPPPLGPPRHLIETTEGLVPVEVKSGACPRSGPHAAHVAQLMTYCVLVEDTLGNAGFRRPLSPGFTPWCTSAFNPSNSRDSSLRMSRAV